MSVQVLRLEVYAAHERYDNMTLTKLDMALNDGWEIKASNVVSNGPHAGVIVYLLHKPDKRKGEQPHDTP